MAKTKRAGDGCIPVTKPRDTGQLTSSAALKTKPLLRRYGGAINSRPLAKLHQLAKKLAEQFSFPLPSSGRLQGVGFKSRPLNDIEHALHEMAHYISITGNAPSRHKAGVLDLDAFVYDYLRVLNPVVSDAYELETVALTLRAGERLSLWSTERVVSRVCDAAAVTLRHWDSEEFSKQLRQIGGSASCCYSLSIRAGYLVACFQGKI